LEIEPENLSIRIFVFPLSANKQPAFLLENNWELRGKPLSPKSVISKLRVKNKKRKDLLCHVQECGRYTGLDLLAGFLVKSGVSQFSSSFERNEK
jgi:hypothetical protein